MNGWHCILDAACDLNSVGPCGLVDSDHDVSAGLRISAQPDVSIEALVLHAVDRGGNILQIDGRAVVLTDDETVVVRRGDELALWLEKKCTLRSIDLTGATVSRAILDRRTQSREIDVPIRHQRWIGFDAHRTLCAEDIHITDA